MQQSPSNAGTDADTDTDVYITADRTEYIQQLITDTLTAHSTSATSVTANDSSSTTIAQRLIEQYKSTIVSYAEQIQDLHNLVDTLKYDRFYYEQSAKRATNKYNILYNTLLEYEDRIAILTDLYNSTSHTNTTTVLLSDSKISDTTGGDCAPSGGDCASPCPPTTGGAQSLGVTAIVKHRDIQTDTPSPQHCDNCTTLEELVHHYISDNTMLVHTLQEIQQSIST
jgi:hypothetical protein